MASCAHCLDLLEVSTTSLFLVSCTDRCSGQGCTAPFLLGVSSEVCNFSHLYPLSKQKYKLIEGRFPLRNRLGPLFGYVLQAHIQHFHDRLVIWEHTAPFQHLPQGVV